MNILKPFGTESFLIGIGLAAASYLFGPAIKQGARGVAVKGMQGALMAGDVANDTMQTSKNKLDTFMQGFKDKDRNSMEMDQSFKEDLINELRADREQYTNALNEMVSTMKNLQEDIQNLKLNGNNSNETTEH